MAVKWLISVFLLLVLCDIGCWTKDGKDGTKRESRFASKGWRRQLNWSFMVLIHGDNPFYCHGVGWHLLLQSCRVY